MYCKHCGKEIKNNYKFCKSCGNKTEKTQQNVYEDIRANAYTEQPLYTNSMAQKPKKKRTGLIVAFVIFALLVGAVVVFIGSAFVAGITESIASSQTDAEDEIIKEEKVQPQPEAAKASDESADTDGVGILGIGDNATGAQDSTESHPADNKTTPSSIPLLTFALSFSDVKMSMDALDWYDYIYGEGYYDMGSVDDYYRDSSKNQFTFTPATESYNTANDGIIDITMDTKHPGFNFSNRSEDDYYAEGFEFFGDVLQAANEYVDFSTYDENCNGFVAPNELTLVFIFAGYENYEEFENPVSTYSCSLIYDDFYEIDGIRIDECIYTSEKDPYNSGDNQIAGIGVICHELGHALDLPDLYDTDYSSEGLAFHCLMAGGCDNATETSPYGTLPAPLTAWERDYLGFETPQVILSDGTYDVFARSMDEYNILKIDDGDGYFLIENVDYVGFGQGLDYNLKSAGIAIWYINKSVVESNRRMYENTINDDEDKYGVMLMEANDTEHLSNENFNYNRVYDHYHYLGGDNIFVSDSGIKIEVLDNPNNKMRVEITLP